MRKLIFIILGCLLSKGIIAQSYLESLNKLNKYLETYGAGTLGPIEIKDGYFISYSYRKKEYDKVKMEDLAAATINEKFNYVVLACKSRGKCVYSTLTKSKTYYANYWATDRNAVLTLVQLLNNFISSYDKEMGIDYVVLSTTGCILGNCENGSGTFMYNDSSSYYGNWKNGKKDGEGTLAKKDGIRISGNWQDDAIAGRGKITYPINDLAWDKRGGKNELYEGEIKDNQPNGEGILYIYNSNYKNKTTLKGNFVNGKINGKGEFYNLHLDTKYELKEESYIGNYKDGLYDGFGIYQLTSHFPKAKKKGLDDTIRYEGSWINGKKEGKGTYLNNHVYEAEDYTGEWKNGLKNGMGICHYKIYDGDLKAGKMKAGDTFDGIWLNGNEHTGKLTTNTGFVLYDGGQKERDAYWAEVKKASDQYAKWRDEEWEKGKKEREELAERNTKNAAACVCSKCGGTGTMSIRSAKIWYSDVYENGKKVGTATNSGWEYEDIKCTRCLGTGKCK